MVKKESKKNDHEHHFVIENNIIKGRTLSCEFDDYNIGKLILDSLNSEPNHIGQIDSETGARTSFAEMKHRSVLCALWLKKQGIGPNDVVTICTNNQVDDYIPVLATLCLGAIYNPWYHGIDLHEARRLMNLLHPRFIFACESVVEILLKAAKIEKINTKIIVIDRDSHLLSMQDILSTVDLSTSKREIDDFRCVEIKDPKHKTMILLSSGTVGPSKCVERSAYSVMQYFHESWKTSKNYHAICLWYVSFYWYCGTIYFLESVINKSTRVTHENYDPEDTCRVIDEFKVEILVLPISLIKDLLKHNVFERYNLSSVKSISIGGSYLNRSLFEALESKFPNVHIDNLYGLTEVGSRCNDSQRRSDRSKLGSIGFIKSNMQMKVVDPKTGETLGPNKIGEFCFKSETNMTGYYKDPEATKKAIDSEGWLHTGDLGYYDENGEIVFTERLAEMMRFRDNEISPLEIEEALISHPEVIDVCVVPVPHSTDNHHPMAFVTKFPGAKVTEEELVRVSSELGDHKVLRGGVKFVEDMPRVGSGTINRKNMKEMAKAYAFL